MTRNFGMVSRITDRGIYRDPAQSRVGATHEPLKPIQLSGHSSRLDNYRDGSRSGLSTPDRNLRELITMCAVFGFLLFFGLCIAAAFAAAVVIVDWVGVAETAVRIIDLDPR